MKWDDGTMNKLNGFVVERGNTINGGLEIKVFTSYIFKKNGFIVFVFEMRHFNGGAHKEKKFFTIKKMTAPEEEVRTKVYPSIEEDSPPPPYQIGYHASTSMIFAKADVVEEIKEKADLPVHTIILDTTNTTPFGLRKIFPQSVKFTDINVDSDEDDPIVVICKESVNSNEEKKEENK